jgi:chlorophyll(ide) b reductase
MDGRGATGNATPKGAAYGATKSALPQLTKSLAAEVKGSGVSVHITSPGMVITDLLMREENRNRAAFVRIMNILAEKPNTVAEWMVPRMRGVTGNGKYFKFLTAPGVLWRFANFWRMNNRLIPMPSKTAKSQ